MCVSGAKNFYIFRAISLLYLTQLLVLRLLCMMPVWVKMLGFVAAVNFVILCGFIGW